MSENIFTEEEREQMRRLEVYRKLALSIILKYLVPLAIVFVLTASGVLTFFWIKARMAPDRFEARSGLFFYPKQTSEIKAMDIKQAIALFGRHSVLQKTSEELDLPEKERKNIRGRITIEQTKKKPNLVLILARAASAGEAIRLVNMFSDLCILEYINYQTEDLQNRLKAIEKRKQDLADSILKCEEGERELVKAIGSLTPVQELERLRKAISDQKAQHSNINIQLANEKARKEKLENLLKSMNQAALKYASRLKEFLAEMERLEKEIFRLRQIYTDINPKLQTVVTEWKNKDAIYRAFLLEKGIVNFNKDTLQQADKINEDLKTSIARLEMLAENQKALSEEIAHSEKNLTTIAEILPKYNEIRQQRSALQLLGQTIEESISEIQYLLLTVKSDIKQVERADHASAEKALDKKIIALAGIAALVLTGMFASLLVLLEILFGKVKDLEELQLYKELIPLGAYPSSSAMFPTRTDEKTVLDGIYYKFQATSVRKKIVFEGIMPGSQYVKEIQDTLDWNHAMNGIKMLRLNIVPTQEFEENDETDKMTPLGAILYSGAKGVMAVENPYALSPAELELMTNDVKELLKTYDMILISRKEPLKRNGVYFRQMLEFSDCAIFYFGAGTTTRSMLHNVINLQKSGGYTIMAILTGANNIASIMAGE